MQRITYFERQQVELYLRMDKAVRWIEKRLRRKHGVIAREIRRNSGDHTPYTAAVAQRIHEERKKRTNRRKIEKPENRDLRDYVVKKLKDDWSPEQIAGRLGKDKPFGSKGISHESIYDYVYNGEGQYEYLYPHLRTRRPRRRKKLNRRKRAKITIKNRIPISERPGIVDEKKQLGHWETDSLLFSKEKSLLSVQHERKSKLCRLHKTRDKTAQDTEDALWESIESLPREMWLSITRDNGLENAYHDKTTAVFDIFSFFCDPYASWQKGGVENTNKLIRQYLPRNTDISKLTDEDVYRIQEKLNNRPRKSLNYLTPNEVIAKVTRGGAINP